MSYYVHQVPGRIRVRIPAIRHNRYRGTEVKHLLDVVGVDTVEVNHLTGSMVANFNPDIVEARLLLAILSEKGYFDHNRAVTCDGLHQAVHCSGRHQGQSPVFRLGCWQGPGKAAGFPYLRH